MKFVEFVENRYQELNYSLQKKYDIVTDAETRSLQELLQIARTWLKWILLPKAIFLFIAVKAGWVKEPEPVITNKLKADMEAKKAAAATPIETALPADAEHA